MKTKKMCLACAAAALALVSTVAGGPLNPPAGPVTPTNKTLQQVEPRAPIESLAGTPFSMHRITQPGSYYLTGNISLAAGKTVCIEVGADGVTIDLNGFTLNGLNSEGTFGVRVSEKFSADGLRIHNGHITDWGTGIDGLGLFGAVFDNLRLTFNDVYGIDAGSHAVLTNCTAVVCGNGVYLRDGGTISGCTAAFCGRGFDLGGFANASACAARDCTEGFYANVGCTVQNCTAGACPTGFLGMFGNALTGCNAEACNDGFSFSDRCVLTDCKAGGGFGPGIVVSADSLVDRCTVSGAALIGISIGERSVVRGCNVMSCGGIGIYCGGNGSTVRDNNVTGCSLDHGIFFEASFGLVEGNSATGSGKFGIAVGGLGNLVVSNRACRSSQLSGGFADYSIVSGNNGGPLVVGTDSFTTTSPYANFSCGFVTAASEGTPAAPKAVEPMVAGPSAYPGPRPGENR